MLKVEKVSCGYNGTDVVHDISFSVEKGESLCILGPNGCGKTTLLRAIAGLLPSKGTIDLFNKPISTMKRRDIAAKIAFMGQFTSIYFSYSVYETVMLGRYCRMQGGIFSQPSKQDKEIVESSLEKTGVADLANRQITELSGGQLQRVFLARTLAQDPDIILLDEPTNHLDLKHQIDLVQYLKSWSKTENRAVIGVMHDVNLAMQLSDKAMLLDNGKIAAIGGWGDLLKGDLLADVYGTDIKAYMTNSYAMWKDYSDL